MKNDIILHTEFFGLLMSQNLECPSLLALAVTNQSQNQCGTVGRGTTGQNRLRERAASKAGHGKHELHPKLSFYYENSLYLTYRFHLFSFIHCR